MPIPSAILTLLAANRYGFRDMDYYLMRFSKLSMFYGPRILVGVVVFYLGLWVIRRLSDGMARLMRLRHVDVSLIPFLRSLLSIGMKVFLAFSILSFIGINTASFLTALGAAGLAIGLALQGSLSNFAGGVLILLFKPFKAGDVIEAQGHRGTVQEIQILYTVLVTPDNKKIVIPNGNLSNKDITNFTAEMTRRVDIRIPVSHRSDLKQAQAILRKIIEYEPLALKEPAPVVGVHDLTGTASNIDVLFWTLRPDYTKALYSVNEKIKLAFDEAGIRFSDPSQDITIYTNPTQDETEENS